MMRRHDDWTKRRRNRFLIGLWLTIVLILGLALEDAWGAERWTQTDTDFTFKF